MPHAHKSQVYDSSPAQMWQRIGDYNNFHSWHPAVEETKTSEGGVRELVLGDDAGSVFETHTDGGDLHYSYRIDRSPLPVADYDATIRVQPHDGGCEVVWTADFTAEGASDEEAVAVIEGIFQGGLDAL
ncbi:MAG: SRPBCC family protein [Solirubrobacterales bacterium]